MFVHSQNGRIYQTTSQWSRPRGGSVGVRKVAVKLSVTLQQWYMLSLLLQRLIPDNSEKIYELEDVVNSFDDLQKVARSVLLAVLAWFFFFLFVFLFPSWLLQRLLLAEHWRTTRGSRRNVTRVKWRAWDWRWSTCRRRATSCGTCSRRRATSTRASARRCPGWAARTLWVPGKQCCMVDC